MANEQKGAGSKMIYQKSGRIRHVKGLRNEDGLEALGMMQSNNPMKHDYSEMISCNEEIIKLAQDGYNFIETSLQNPKSKPNSRSTVQDFTFINKKKSTLEQKVDKLIRSILQKLQCSSSYEEAIRCVVDLATRLVRNYKAGSDMIEYVDLSDKWGERGDIFACICAIAPDPDDESKYSVDDIENEEDIFKIKSDEEIQKEDRKHYFFFGYYGEKWEDFSFIESIETERKIREWLLCKLCRTCHDKMESVAMM